MKLSKGQRIALIIYAAAALVLLCAAPAHTAHGRGRRSRSASMRS